jgi:hypothetical protein
MAIRAAALAAAICAVPTSLAVAGQVASPALIDRNMTMGAGATIVATAGETLARGTDAVVPPRLFEERGLVRRSANIAYRLMKFAYFEVPQERWLMVANHEVFGHGARLRERFNGRIGYHVRVPEPYGPGGGALDTVLKTGRFLAIFKNPIR